MGGKIRTVAPETVHPVGVIPFYGHLPPAPANPTFPAKKKQMPGKYLANTRGTLSRTTRGARLQSRSLPPDFRPESPCGCDVPRAATLEIQ
jgi:hypothetical protein